MCRDRVMIDCAIGKGNVLEWRMTSRAGEEREMWCRGLGRTKNWDAD